jgi:DNA mismatch repair protein MutS2
MNAHALSVLEFGRVRELVAERAGTSAGASRVRALEPRHDVEWLEQEQARVTAMRTLMESESGWRSEPIPEIAEALIRLRVAGATLQVAELAAIGNLLASSRLTKATLSKDDAPAISTALLKPFRDVLIVDASAEQAISKVIAEDGSIQDGASPLLRRLRRELRDSEGKLVSLLEKVMGRLDAHQRVPDMSVTIRNGRYVIPVRREGRGAVGGLVHDSSNSGATLFVEPPAAIEACNRIRELEADEVREVDRLLAELSERVRPLAEPLMATLDAMSTLDGLFARARFAAEFRCTAVAWRQHGSGIVMNEARHPLLQAQGIAVVPFTLVMEPGERTLLVSGPNTGGKTVLLKTIGLVSSMAQSGIPVPLAAGSALVVYDDVFADVGDEQSIEASLSTFSAHLRNIAEILRRATPRSLVLLDELGSGTDPIEGSALGGAVLEDLTRRGAMSVATTHLGALKELASEVPGVVNASLQFDADRLAPTYLLIKGIPGRSYGLSIARRLGLPDEVLANAEERVPKVERDVNALLASLETREASLTRLEAAAAESLEGARDTAHRLAEREARLREREVVFERESRQEARRYLLESRHEVERTIRELRQSAADQADKAATEEAAREARQRVEQLAEAQRARLQELDRPLVQRSGTGVAVDPEPGMLVIVHPMGGKTGRVIERRDGNLLVALGAVKMTFPADAVTVAPVQAVPTATVMRGDEPDVEVATEIDVRGVRAGEVDDLVMQAVDAAIRADLKSIRVIHGKGTGALRERVAEMLRKDTRVRGFRPGGFNEGGTGVTVVDL